MDIVRLEKDIRQKAKEYLDDINEANLKAFAESTKFIAQSVLEDYFFKVDKLYTSGPLMIKKEEVFDRFLDFKNGYRAQMKQWMLNNDIVLREMVVSPSLKYPELCDVQVSSTHKHVFTIGTIIAVGLLVISELWIAVAAELLTLGVAISIYKRNKQAAKKEYAFRVRSYELQLEKERARLVDGLIKDIKQWLDNAESYSNGLLTNIGVDL